MNKFRIPKKLYRYNSEQDIIEAYNYFDSEHDDMRCYYYNAYHKNKIIVETDEIVFSNNNMPHPGWNWSLFTNLKMCKMFRQKVL